MRHLLPLIGAFIGGLIGVTAFPGSAPDNQTLFALLGAGVPFLFLGLIVWVLPMFPPPPPPTLEQLQYQAWVDSWTPPAPQVQVIYQRDLYAEHQRHLQDQARMGWLMGDRDYPPTDYYGR